MTFETRLCLYLRDRVKELCNGKEWLKADELFRLYDRFFPEAAKSISKPEGNRAPRPTAALGGEGGRPRGQVILGGTIWDYQQKSLKKGDIT